MPWSGEEMLARTSERVKVFRGRDLDFVRVKIVCKKIRTKERE